MKKLIKSSAFLLLVFLMTTSCEESAIEPLSGIYEAPAEYPLTNLFAQTISKQDNGTRIFTMKIASDGVSATYDTTNSSYSFSGSGNYVSIDFLSNSDTLDIGTYTAAANDAAIVGNFIQGYDTELWGMQFYNWGTCWFTIENGIETGKHISGGNISVSRNESIYTVTVTVTTDEGENIFAEYKGEIAALGE